ncbi:MAG: tetratricopeptide repeat protein [Chloroflexi bacterium]|nr:tetratricopeptide repeat protein [Chloroflexota bacterium]MBU1749305.1 tetratricopeptide repeat protein [Chloroflexota bacterium]
MLCPSCGNENPPGFAYCGLCGASLPQPCLGCGLQNPPGLAFCGHCGADLARSSPAALQAALEGERRFVIALFADLAGFTPLSERLDPEEAVTLLNCCLDEMTQAVIQHGGWLDKYIGDGLMAVFGAPVAHEDDPERALRAALAMQEAVGRLELDLDSPIALHFGLACGQVVSAGVGGRGRREYTVIGSAVNMAARLEDASAPGQILVNEELARLTDHAFSFRPVTLGHLQGWDGPVRVFELLALRPGAVPSRRGRVGPQVSPLVGREIEMAQLRNSLVAVRAGQGGLVSVIGEAGVGKSRLLREVHAQIEGELIWLGSHAVEMGEPVRYSSFQTLLRHAVGVTGPIETAQVTERLQTSLAELMSDRVEESAPYLGHLLGVPLPPVALERLDEERLKWQIARAVQEWVLALTRSGPVVLVMEDLHWADPLSVELLAQLLPLAEQAALLVVMAYRPESDRPAWRLRETSARTLGPIYTELWLAPLSPAATRQMVGHLLETGQVPEQALSLIQRRTEGNPLFVEEIVRSLVDRAILVQQDWTWGLAPHWAESAIPDTIQGLIQARVDRLDREAKRVLQVTACVGRRFSYQLLTDIGPAVGIPPARLDHCLAALTEAALVQAEDTAPPNAPAADYTFRHVLIRDIVHSSLLKSTRAQLHAAVACWYEEHTLGEPEPPYALLSYHYEQTDDDAKKLFYYTQAGHQAARTHANAEARLFFTKALALATDPTERLELLLGRERVCHLMGDRAQQKADLDELLQLANQSQNDRQRAAVYHRLAAYHESQSDYPAARTMAAEGLAAAWRAGDIRAEAENLQRIASATWRLGEFAAALDASQSALEAAHAIGDAAGEALSLTTMGVVHRSQGDPAAARACYQQAIAIRRSIGDQRGEAINLSQLGNVLHDLGQLGDAFDHHQQALDLFRLVGDWQGEAWSLGGLGTVYLECGANEAARSCYQDALSIRRSIGDRRGEGVALGDLGGALLALGEQPAAQAHLEQAVSILQSLGARRDEVDALTGLALTLEKAGDLDGAQDTHQLALSRRLELGQEAASMENVAGLARLALARGDQENARAHADEVLAYLHDHGPAHLRAPFLAYQTGIRVLQACGDEAEARTWLARAYQPLMERAAGIANPDLRRSFLENVPAHRAILNEQTSSGERSEERGLAPA